jgi:GNAT superfamily N-acetyltransferase
MKVTLREDIHPNPDFYYQLQFAIYREPYLIWDRETWQTILATCDVYCIEIDGGCGGDVVLEDRGKGVKYVVDFSVLPDYQGKGIGKLALEELKRMAEKLAAVTRKETLQFFVKSGFVLRRILKNYYYPGVDGYYIVFERKPGKERHEVGIKRGEVKRLENVNLEEEDCASSSNQRFVDDADFLSRREPG